MSLSLIELKISGVKIFKNQIFNVTFRNTDRITNHDKNNNVVSHLYGPSNYRNNVLAFAGINASGKTSSLELIKFVLDTYLQGKSIQEFENVDIFNEEVIIKALFFDRENKGIYQIKTIIDNIPFRSTLLRTESRLYIRDETIWFKKSKANDSRSSFIVVEDEHIIETRTKVKNKIGNFLKTDFSIFESIVGSKGNVPIISTFYTTNANHLSSFTDYEQSAIKYLDPQIEEFHLIQADWSTTDSQNIIFHLKFKDAPQAFKVTLQELPRYLSSGTIKGISLLSKISTVMKTGGYLLIDEIENHFNKKIVESVIAFFQSEVNQLGATLIFSTHYSEILNIIPRKDNIFLLEKTVNKIQLDRLSVLAKSIDKNKNEVKNSDLILSGIFGTAPAYEAYMDVKNYLVSEVREASADYETED